MPIICHITYCTNWESKSSTAVTSFELHCTQVLFLVSISRVPKTKNVISLSVILRVSFLRTLQKSIELHYLYTVVVFEKNHIGQYWSQHLDLQFKPLEENTYWEMAVLWFSKASPLHPFSKTVQKSLMIENPIIKWPKLYSLIIRTLILSFLIFHGVPFFYQGMPCCAPFKILHSAKFAPYCNIYYIFLVIPTAFSFDYSPQIAQVYKGISYQERGMDRDNYLRKFLFIFHSVNGCAEPLRPSFRGRKHSSNGWKL